MEINRTTTKEFHEEFKSDQFLRLSQEERIKLLEKMTDDVYALFSMKSVDTNNFVKLVQLLEEFQVKFILVGGYAMGYYGHIRVTSDIDFWAECSKENSMRIFKALLNFGYSDVKSNFFTEQDAIFKVGEPPNLIEILLQLKGVDFGFAYRDSELITFKGHLIHLLSLEDLIRNKRSTGRLKDLADLRELEHIKEHKDSLLKGF